ncbi:hypothetical protein PanWU01x14_237930 [Parasponia andersonii]|uniref:Uncharacterized protein n=1 Tax=Parasponia andersonii TaxID=3476 RepID=A0A2P5BHX9_PARAD|nr:hypothetical protein PanWU01x14_237930 [Parasponia andersonii]
MSLACTEESPPNNIIWLNRHLLDETSGSFNVPCPAKDINNAAIVLHFGLQLVNSSHELKTHQTFLNQTCVTASIKHSNECDIVWFHRKPLHFHKQRKCNCTEAMDCKPTNHRIPVINISFFHIFKYSQGILYASTFSVHVNQSNPKLPTQRKLIFLYIAMYGHTFFKVS